MGRWSDNLPEESVKAQNRLMKNASYWSCQLAGWGAFSALGLTVAVMENGPRPSAIIGYLFFFVYSVGFSHLLRSLAVRRGWMRLPTLQAVARLSGGAVAIAAVQAGLVVTVYRAIEGSPGPWSQPSSIVFMFLWLSVVGNIWVILYFSITALRHSREVRRQQTQMKLALSEAELRALESQLNPHFLFNCLNSIRGMISENPQEAQDMVTRLANILRYSLQRDRRHTVPLASEVEIVSDYLALESIRFESRLRTRVEVDEAALEVPVPPMLLQTLVENAIKHGVEDLPAGSEISIRAFMENDTLRVAVRNAGELTEPQPTSTQIGLNNARERLRILYGERAALQLLPGGGGQIVAKLSIPRAL
jgi:hypothetical protein